MANGSLARRYARALIALGSENECVELLAEDLNTFSAVLTMADGLLHKALNNPALTIAERKSVLAQVLAKLSLQPFSVNFLSLLVDKNRLGLFEDISRAYGEMADELAGRIRAEVRTAAALDDVTRERIRAVLSEASGKVVMVDFNVDPSLIGGIYARVGDTSFDASIRSRLVDIQQTLIAG